MRFIPTRFHGALDYVVGLVFIAAPWLFGFSEVSWATWTIVIAGILVLLQTIFTDFEVGLIHKIPMQSHLMVDFGLGVILALSPWLFNFADRVFMPHLVGGIFAILASLTTHRRPSESYRTRHATQETMH
ncbi:SPW repeat protein [Pontibacter anaerobius]|uniref:SPW repeat protein n=1 Tax=Pontibacter anaerobius TaxID=2993940 RepID=A0ABT3RIZ1_9BACT|nr:SPW repeat protein [Pontibacter anaerobius]MCX2741770.1 SPW repeat protein [Pontibacter anaerobius]